MSMTPPPWAACWQSGHGRYLARRAVILDAIEEALNHRPDPVVLPKWRLPAAPAEAPGEEG